MMFEVFMKQLDLFGRTPAETAAYEEKCTRRRYWNAYFGRKFRAKFACN